jgi:hypothetical protein
VISAKEHPTWCPRCQGSAPGLPPAGGGWRGETKACAACPCPTARATTPHLASPRWGEVEPGNLFSGNRLKSPHHGRGSATFVAPATEVAPACSSGLTRPTPTEAGCLSPFVAGGTAPCKHTYTLQALAIQVRRANPADWHRFCLSVHRKHGIPTLRQRHTDGMRPSLEETALLALLCSKAPRIFASNFLGAA